MKFILCYFTIIVAVTTVAGLTINAGYDDYYTAKNNGYFAPKKAENEKKQDLSKIPGIPGQDYPIHHAVPETSFSCHNVPALPGMYANIETGCQAYHVCHDGREGHQGSSFLCTNGTLFNQKEFACDWWYNVNCHAAPSFYNLNRDPKKNPYFEKQTKEQEQQAQAEAQKY